MAVASGSSRHPWKPPDAPQFPCLSSPVVATGRCPAPLPSTPACVSSARFLHASSAHASAWLPPLGWHAAPPSEDWPSAESSLPAVGCPPPRRSLAAWCVRFRQEAECVYSHSPDLLLCSLPHVPGRMHRLQGFPAWWLAV